LDAGRSGTLANRLLENVPGMLDYTLQITAVCCGFQVKESRLLVQKVDVEPKEKNITRKDKYIKKVQKYHTYAPLDWYKGGVD